MLAMDYIPANGGDPVTWYHGFYAFVDPNRVFPLQAAIVASEQHEQINPGCGTPTRARNLFESIRAEDQRPKSILNLRFYASGHQYDVYVSQVALLVDQAGDSAAEIGRLRRESPARAATPSAAAQ